MERHKLDILSLFAGAVFVAIAVVGLAGSPVLSVTDLRWLGPAALVGFGVVLVVTAGGSASRRRVEAADADTASTAETDPVDGPDAGSPADE